MGITGWTWLAVGGTFALYAGVALWSKAHSAVEYYVADRTLHPAVAGMATATDWMSAASFMSMAGLVAVMGRDGASYLMGWTGGYVLLAVLLAPYLRKYGKYTVPQFVGDRYYSDGARFVAILCAIVISFTYVAGQTRGVAIVLARLLDVPVATAVVIGALLVLLFAVMGGMKGITAVQVTQYVVVIVAYLVPAILLALLLTDSPAVPLAPGRPLTPEGAAWLGVPAGQTLLQALGGLSRDLGLVPLTAGARPRIDVFCTTAALMVGTAGLPHIIIRFFTVPKIRDARATAAWALVFIAVLYLAAPAVASFARAGVIATVHGHRRADAPAWLLEWERTGLASFQDRNGDGIMQISGDPAVNEVKVDPDLLVLALPEMAKLPAWVVALVAAGALAAALGTAAGLVLVIAAAFSHDLVRGYLAPRLSERAELGWARAAAFATVLAAALGALHPPAAVAQIVAWAFGFAASSFFPVIVLGIFWRRATREGAVAGMIAGMTVTALYLAWFTVRRDLNVPAHWLFGISPEGFGAVGAVVNAVVTIAVSLASRPPPEEVQRLVASLRYPREARR
ncbi:MAG TPA: sodium:solute symporter family protein [Anaeromyxobacteraceae bacterium]|nr:sodium:solute symporter family protein [Anaeromyxobacteraceae bacterium]